MANISWDSEKELEDWIYNYALINYINPLDGSEVHKVFRQLEISLYGIADIVFIRDDYEPEITIVEVKKDFVNVKTMAQIARYLKGIEEYLAANFQEDNFQINLMCVASSISRDDDSIWLSDLLSNNMSYETYECRVDLNSGISFEKTHGWKKTNPCVFSNEIIAPAFRMISGDYDQIEGSNIVSGNFREVTSIAE